MIKKIISGGQTGAGQATLDATIRLGIPMADGLVPILFLFCTYQKPDKVHLNVKHRSNVM